MMLSQAIWTNFCHQQGAEEI